MAAASASAAGDSAARALLPSATPAAEEAAAGQRLDLPPVRQPVGRLPPISSGDTSAAAAATPPPPAAASESTSPAAGDMSGAVPLPLTAKPAPGAAAGAPPATSAESPVASVDLLPPVLPALLTAAAAGSPGQLRRRTRSGRVQVSTSLPCRRLDTTVTALRQLQRTMSEAKAAARIKSLAARSRNARAAAAATGGDPLEASGTASTAGSGSAAGPEALYALVADGEGSAAAALLPLGPLLPYRPAVSARPHVALTRPQSRPPTLQPHLAAVANRSLA